MMKPSARYRHEYKYIIDVRQEIALMFRAAGLMRRDPHVEKDGSYIVRSLYLDDIDDSCMRQNLSGADPRSKFRIRYYGTHTERIMLEKKSKRRSMCLKESVPLSREECEIFMSGGVPDFRRASEKKQKLFSEIMMRGLYPKVIVTYQRVPFIYEGGNVRVTFDRNLSSSCEFKRFLEGDYAVRPVLPCGQTVLEVKWDEVMPAHIKDVLKFENLRWTAFSKYFKCRVFHL